MRTRSDTIRVKGLLLGQLLPFLLSLASLLDGVSRSSKSPASLLVHLRPRGDTVNGHEKDLLRLDLGEQMVYIREYREYHLFFRYPEVRIVLGRWGVGAVVDDPVLA